MKNKKNTFFTPSFIFLLLITICMLFFCNTFINTTKPNKTTYETTTTSHPQHLNTTQKKSVKKSHKKTNLNHYLFLGDSYTFLLEPTIKRHNPQAIVKGVSGVEPGYWNEHFDTLPDDDEIKGVILLIGVNGVTFDNNLPDKEKLISSLSKKYKDKTIYVEKVFPVGKKFTNANCDSFNKAIKFHNKKIKLYCDKYSNVVFIDTTKGLVNKKGYLKYTEDGLHIKPSKQGAFYKNIKNTISDID